MDFEQRSNEKQFHNKRHRFLNKYIMAGKNKRINKYLWNQGLGRPLMCPNFFLEPLHHPLH